MDQQQQPRWRPTRRQFLWTVPITVVAVVALVVAINVLGYVREWKWTGLVKDKDYPWRTHTSTTGAVRPPAGLGRRAGAYEGALSVAEIAPLDRVLVGTPTTLLGSGPSRCPTPILQGVLMYSLAGSDRT